MSESLQDRSTVLETNENVFVLLHDHAEDRSTEGNPLLLGDLFPLELLEHVIVFFDEFLIHNSDNLLENLKTGQPRFDISIASSFTLFSFIE